MAGRNPKPTALKLVTGNPGKRPLNKAEPKYDDGIPICPSWLRDKVARAEWKRLTKLLGDAGVLTVADGNSLAMYCYVVSQIDAITQNIAENGYVAFDIKINQDTGEEIMVNPKSNPLALRLENYIKELRAYSALFGLDPSTRGKIHAKEPDGKKTDKKERFFK